MNDIFEIRKAAAGDCPALADMIRELAAYHGETSVMDAQTLRAQAFGNSSGPDFLIALANGRPAGFAAFLERFNMNTGRKSIEVDALHVRFRFRRRGLGHALIRDVARHAGSIGADSLRLNVRPENWSARAFYMRTGFTESASKSLSCKLEGKAFACLTENNEEPFYWRQAA